MKYAVIFILILLLILLIVIFYLKNTSNKNSLTLPNTKKIVNVESSKDNFNPHFEIELVDFKKAQLGINKSSLGENIIFKKNKNKRINVYSINKQYIGQVAVKDHKKLPLLISNPNYFEGEIYSFIKTNIATKKVIISIQAKVEFSKEIYFKNKDHLNTLITLHSLFVPSEIIETNYGPSTVIEVFQDHLLVEIPSLGNREIYDIDTILNNGK